MTGLVTTISGCETELYTPDTQLIYTYTHTRTLARTSRTITKTRGVKNGLSRKKTYFGTRSHEIKLVEMREKENGWKEE